MNANIDVARKNRSNTTFVFQLMIFTTTYKTLGFIPFFP